MNGYILIYILAGSIIAPFMAEVALDRYGDASSTERVLNNAIAFWLWPLLVIIMLAASMLKARQS